MGFTTNSLQIESVTPEKAADFLRCNYVHNRKPRKGWVKFLANEMAEGRFMPTAEVHIMYRNGEPTMVNGQHTCAAIVMYGKPVRVTVRKTSTSEVGQIAMMYAHGHDNGIKRTFNDGLGAYNVGEEIGLGPSYVKALATALRHIRAGFAGEDKVWMAPSPMTELIEIMPEWAPYAKMFWEHVVVPAGSYARIRQAVKKRANLSVLLVTYRYQPALAKDFWGGIVSPGIDDTDPRWYARRIIEENIERRSGSTIMSTGMASRMIAKCWDKYCNGQSMAMVPRRKDIDEGGKIVIAGTPFTGRQPNPPWWPDED